MSEYQYYEFQAIDRPLTTREMAALRKISTRAQITPTRFQNVYNYGDFKGQPLEILRSYFDAFVYVANWGSQQLMFRMPHGSMDRDKAQQYEVETYLQIIPNDDYDIISFVLEDEEGGGWIDDGESEAWMPSLLPLRADLMEGDLRSLYLAWLATVQWEYVGGREDDEAYRGEDDEEIDDEYNDDDGYGDADNTEPEIPPGLGELTAPLTALVNFLGVNSDLLTVAAERSAPLPSTQIEPGALQNWIRQLPESDKDDWLTQLVDETTPGPAIRRELLQRFRQAHPADIPTPAAGPRRTVGELRALARDRTEQRNREQAERAAQTRARFLDELAEREEDTWDTVEMLIQTKHQASYDQAVALLLDLHDLARHRHTEAAFAFEMRGIRARHAAKSSFIRRLDNAKLRPE